MSETSLIALLLAVISMSLVILTWVIVVTARDLRRLVRRSAASLDTCEDTAREARFALAEVREFLAHANSAARRVESVMQKTCDVAAGVVAQVVRWKGKAQALWGGHRGNGHGAGVKAQQEHED